MMGSIRKPLAMMAAAFGLGLFKPHRRERPEVRVEDGVRVYSGGRGRARALPRGWNAGRRNRIAARRSANKAARAMRRKQRARA